MTESRGRPSGIPGMFPTLAGSPAVQSVNPASVLRVILRGAPSAATDQAPTAPGMPAFGWLLSDQEVAAVATYTQRLGQLGAARLGWRRGESAARFGQAQRLAPEARRCFGPHCRDCVRWRTRRQSDRQSYHRAFGVTLSLPSIVGRQRAASA